MLTNRPSPSQWLYDHPSPAVVAASMGAAPSAGPTESQAWSHPHWCDSLHCLGAVPAPPEGTEDLHLHKPPGHPDCEGLHKVGENTPFRDTALFRGSKVWLLVTTVLKLSDSPCRSY